MDENMKEDGKMENNMGKAKLQVSVEIFANLIGRMGRKLNEKIVKD